MSSSLSYVLIRERYVCAYIYKSECMHMYKCLHLYFTKECSSSQLFNSMVLIKMAYFDAVFLE